MDYFCATTEVWLIVETHIVWIILMYLPLQYYKLKQMYVCVC